MGPRWRSVGAAASATEVSRCAVSKGTMGAAGLTAIETRFGGIR
jgi:hypothetical protein